jgi:hypothetical protein
MSLLPERAADAVGWLATALFASSYLCRGPARLRLVQGIAALLWMLYGVLIRALPVIAANLLVSGLALFSAWRARSHRAGVP